jgi:hypothetical protein
VADYTAVRESVYFNVRGEGYFPVGAYASGDDILVSAWPYVPIGAIVSKNSIKGANYVDAEDFTTELLAEEFVSTLGFLGLVDGAYLDAFSKNHQYEYNAKNLGA